MTVFQLIQAVERDGFSWVPLPASTKQRQALAFKPAAPDTPKVWCCRQPPASRFYLRALLEAADLGIQEVRHGCSDAEYK
eukprot:13451400-Alexandrium_andersonii.AAC.1